MSILLCTKAKKQQKINKAGLISDLMHCTVPLYCVTIATSTCRTVKTVSTVQVAPVRKMFACNQQASIV